MGVGEGVLVVEGLGVMVVVGDGEGVIVVERLGVMVMVGDGEGVNFAWQAENSRIMLMSTRSLKSIR